MILNTAQLAAALGVSDSAITDQVKKGMPRLRAGRRGKPALFDFDKVSAWREKSGFATRIDVLSRAVPPAARPDAGATLPSAILGAAAEWLLAAHDAGFNEPDFEVADLADLGELFIAKLADALEKPLGAAIANALRAAIDPAGKRPATLDQALAKFSAPVKFTEANAHG
jgi:hypothetical protein